MTTRSFRIVLSVIVVIVAGLLIGSTTHQRTSGAVSTTVYACFNSGGHQESSTVGLSPQPCAHSNDSVQSWQVVGYVPTSSTTTTKPAATTTTVVSTSTSSTSSPASTTTTSTTAPAAGLWKPSSASSLTWDWVIGTTPSTSENVQVMDMDGFDNSAAAVTAFHAHGTKVICYLDLGTYEPGRPDLGLIPAKDVGASLDPPFGTEKWLDVRDIAGLTPLINERVGVCASKGFDAVEPDDVDGYTNSTGFPLTGAQQIAYNTTIANAVHAAGMSVLLKNDVDQLAALQPVFDFALNEQCNQFSECGGYSAFTGAGKAVFNAEYSGNVSTFCAADATKHINGSKFAQALDGSSHTACGAW